MPTFNGYHGTNTRFSVFRPEYSGTGGLANAEYGEAYFMTDSPKFATDYARLVTKRKGGTPVVKHIQMTLTNPMTFDFSRDSRTHLAIEESSLNDDILVQEELLKLARAAVHDGLVCLNFNDGGAEQITQYIAFAPSQLEIRWCDTCTEQ